MSIPSAGVLYPSALVAANIRANQIFNSEIRDAQYVPHALTAELILRNQQTSGLQILQDPSKNNSVVAVWAELCSDVEQDCDADPCTITGVEGSTQRQVIDLDCIAKAGFSVNLTALEDNVFSDEDFIARGILRALKTLDEKLALQAITAIVANAGNNVSNNNPYPVNGGVTQIPSYAWTPALFAHLQRYMTLNMMDGSFLLDGGQLYTQEWLAKMNAGNSDGKGAAAMFGTMPLYHDMWNLAAAEVPNDVFMIHPGALAIVTKAKNPSTPTLRYFDQPQWHYKIASRTLPGVEYDVRMAETCVNGVEKRTWSFTATGAVIANPTGCSDDMTGILQFTCANP